MITVRRLWYNALLGKAEKIPSMSKRRNQTPLQSCPICTAHQPVEALRCDQCGAVLRGIPLSLAEPMSVPSGDSHLSRTRISRRLDAPPQPTDWDEGEGDLFAAHLPQPSLAGVLVTGLAIVLGVLGLLFLGSRIIENTSIASIPTFADVTGVAAQPTSAMLVRPSEDPNLPSRTPTSTIDVQSLLLTPTPFLDLTTPLATNSVLVLPSPDAAAFSTPTAITADPIIVPTLSFPSVTPVPPTPTITPTRGNCMQTAKAGDTLIGLAARCGHQDYTIIDVILRQNNMGSAAELKEGQVIEIPYPTEVGAVNPDPLTSDSSEASGSAMSEPTLPPSLQWYTVQQGETAIEVIYKLGITMKILHDLNFNEVDFETCDFSSPIGGSSCNVMLFEGQRLRVPAPAPTATLSPTPSGSETPTPTPTATFNAPFAQSPSNNMLFESFDLPTLRWVASGQLAVNEVYLITVTNQTAGVVYNATTRELYYQLPAEWQPRGGRRNLFEWRVAVAKMDGNTVIPTNFATETRSFYWQGR